MGGAPPPQIHHKSAHTHLRTHMHADTHAHTQRARLLSRRRSAPALNSSKVQGELKPGQEESERRAGVLWLLPGIVGGVVRAGGQAALAPFRIHSALRWYIPALRGEARRGSEAPLLLLLLLLLQTQGRAAEREAGRRGGGGVAQRRRGEQRSTHTRIDTHRDARKHRQRQTPPLPRFPVAYPSLGPPSPTRCTLSVCIHAASGALSLVFPRRSCHWLMLQHGPLKRLERLKMYSCDLFL